MNHGYGCDFVPFSETAMLDVNRCTMGVMKEALNLPLSTPAVGVQALLGTKTFKELMYTTQLKFYLRLINQKATRWSKDAFLDHLQGGWRSPYTALIARIKREVGMVRDPVTVKDIKLVVDFHFLRQLNQGILELGLPALRRVEQRIRMPFINESEASKVSALGWWFIFLDLFGIRIRSRTSS